jgi:hypothetical protein
MHTAHYIKQDERASMAQLFAPFNSAGKKKPMHVSKYPQDKGKDLHAYLNLTAVKYNKKSLQYLLRDYGKLEANAVSDSRLLT